MTQQVAVMIQAPLLAGADSQLEATFAAMRQDVEDNGVLPFTQLRGVHFARFTVVPASDDGDVPPSLVWASSVDGSLDAHLEDLVTAADAGLDQIFGHCEGYPATDDRRQSSRLAFLRAHAIPTQAFYVNTVGRSVEQVRDEAMLRNRIEAFLDERQADRSWDGRRPADVLREVRQFAKDDPSLSWALRPASRPPLLSRASERARFWLVIAAGVLLAPLLAVPAIAGLLLLRLAEWREARSRNPARRLVSRRELALREDQVIQNQFTAAGPVKSGPLRALAARVVLFGAAFASRYVYNNGDLGTVRPLGLHGVDTIHFARWVLIDGGRRVIFMSNYDGSLESYMDDFINKVAWGLNIVFTHGVDYPPTRWAVLDGAQDEQAFKQFLRERQLPSGVWFSGYPHLSAVNITNNAAIRSGLSANMDAQAVQRWVRRF